jgi:D-alanyl-D-alanine carboxypeptidase (penicillin-binding protein 5/6)
MPTVIARVPILRAQPRPKAFRAIKSGLSGAVLLLLAGGITQAQGPKKDDFQTAAPFAILIEAESGTVLFEKNADQLMSPSSMAKLMTTEVVLKAVADKKIGVEDEVTISENAWRKGGASSGGSTMYAALNSRVKVHDLLRSVVIQSGNDACIALAEAVAGNEAAFGAMMTARARELGHTKSTYTNSTGLPDPNQHVTPRELAQLAQHLIRTYPDHYALYAEREFTWNKIKQQNRNPLLAMGIGADGLKTGFTREAGYGLVGSAVQNDLRLILVINGTKSTKERAEEARKLLEWGFRAFEARTVFGEGEPVAEAKVYGGEKGTVGLVGAKPIRVLVPRGSTEKIVARAIYTGPVVAPVSKGQPIGSLKVWRGDSVVMETPLRAAESIARGGMGRRALDAVTELATGLFRAGAERI